MGLIAIGVVIVLIGIAWWFVSKAGVSDAEKRLGRVCLGDVAQATRLIEHELRRSPGLSRQAAALRALESRQRDNS